MKNKNAARRKNGSFLEKIPIELAIFYRFAGNRPGQNRMLESDLKLNRIGLRTDERSFGRQKVSAQRGE